MNLKSLLLSCFFLSASAECQTLKVLTLNLWTGLDYHGTFSIGEYERPETREGRLRLVEQMLKDQQPDVVALQEANPVCRLASRLAATREYDFIDQRVNSGVKIGPVGIPSNLNEGLVILARKDLHLEFVDVWDLSSSWGIIGNALSLHSKEHDIALVGIVNMDGVPVYLVNVHTVAAVPVDSGYHEILSRIADREIPVASKQREVMDEYHERGRAILSELQELSRRLKGLPASRPVIVMGDFNVAAVQPAMNSFLAESGLTDAAAVVGKGSMTTWDPSRNANVLFSRQENYADGERLAPLDLLSSVYDGEPRRIDYVLLNGSFERSAVRGVKTVLDSVEEDLFASDHFGVMAELSLAEFMAKQQKETGTVPPPEESTVEPLPIVSYDTDVGFGYGAKVFLLNTLHRNESFDVVLFNSTKGERWYRFVVSIPDFELRQGKVYPVAFDLTVDYDKYLKNSFFGVGSGSKFGEREYYTREPLEVSLAASRGISGHVVVQAGVKFKYTRNFGFSDTSRLRSQSPSLNAGVVRYQSLFAGYRYDTRDSYINPSRGLVLLAEGEYAPRLSWTNVGLSRVGTWIQYYTTLFYPKTILALRLGVQNIVGNDLPVQVLLPIGGNQTLRGSPQDRYLDKTSAIVNTEIRFPIWWRFGGVLGYDAGRVWSQPTDFTFGGWATNPVVGLRFFMDTYVVRLDFGFGSETTGFYLNFGHLF